MKSKDASNNEAISSDYTFTTTAPDTTVPSIPTNLSATAISSSQIDLAWTASEDNVGVTGYRIFRDSVEIDTTASTTYSDTGLPAETTYSYTVSAYDAAGNVSGQSGSAGATTQDASSALLFETSFNDTCDAEWEWEAWPGTYQPPCYPKYDRALDRACSGGQGEQITSAANMTDGGGGRGQRHWIGDGWNNNSGGLSISFNSTQSELWVRWYIRYPSGFAWDPLSYDKILYFDSGQAQAVVPEWHGTDVLNIWSLSGGNHDSSSGHGWATVMGGATSDGLWHCHEVHLKMDTNGSNGVGQYWIDGVLHVDYSNINFGTQSGWDAMLIGSNQYYPNNGQCLGVDFDDIAISNTGYIGPLSTTGDTTPPTVSITSPTQSQTVSGNTTISSTASDNIGVAGVQFKLNGTNLGAEDTVSPYSISWDTTVSSDGSHTLTATARDAAGNQTTSSSVGVTINNGGSSGTIFFQEPFEDTSFGSRGWYDNTAQTLSTAEYVGGNSSAEYHFLQAGTTPTSGGAIRKKFTDTEEVYVSYYVKYSSNWEGSNRTYHPHEFLILTNENTDWAGPAYTHMTAYIEQNEGEPLLAIQDGMNIDETQIGVDLTSTTENRSVAGCNGDSDGYGNGSCYSMGTVHWNGKSWKAGSNYFQDTPGAYYKNDWHFIEAYLKLNSISSGVGVADGVIQYWYDGNLIINHNDVMMRTGQHPNMRFNQFIIAPWIGDGSPIDQTFWVDDLTVADYRVGGSGDTIPPTASISINSTNPTNSPNTTLSLSASDPSGVTEMKISNVNDFNTAILYTYNTVRSWVLSTGDGLKTVYAWFKDSVGNWNATPVTDTITLDATAPTISNISTSNITTNSVNINFTTSENTTSYLEYGLTTSYGNQAETNTTPITIYQLPITNLSSNTTYHYRITSTDSANNISQSTNQTFTTIQASTPDTTPPANITNLSSSNITQTSVDLNWTSPGDDDHTGTASGYDLRYSTSNITNETDFNNATQLSGEPIPQTAGTTQSFYIAVGLSPNTTYYFTLKTRDEVPNWSDLSNVVSFTTLEETTPPEPTPDGGGGG